MNGKWISAKKGEVRRIVKACKSPASTRKNPSKNGQSGNTRHRCGRKTPN